MCSLYGSIKAEDQAIRIFSACYGVPFVFIRKGILNEEKKIINTSSMHTETDFRNIIYHVINVSRYIEMKEDEKKGM